MKEWTTTTSEVGSCCRSGWMGVCGWGKLRVEKGTSQAPEEKGYHVRCRGVVGATGAD